MKKRITLTASLCCLVFAVLASCHRLPVQAAERKAPPYILDVRRGCVLDIQTDTTQNTAGVKLSIYQVGRIDATSLSLSFVLTEEYEDSKVDLLAEGNAGRKKAIEALCKYVSEKDLKPLKSVMLDNEGTAQLEVPQGAYLICQAEEGETQIQATLVSVPYVSESLNEWIYDMQVQLKAAAVSVPTGDSQNIAGYAVLAIAAVLLLLLLMFARKRSKKN